MCVFSACGLPIFTAGEDERTGVLVHWEIMELQLALGVDGHPGRDRNTQRQRHLKVWRESGEKEKITRK